MKTTIKLLGFGLLTALSLASCSDQFLEDKKNYDNANTDIYNYYSGANGRLNDIYAWCLPSVGDITWKTPSMGNADFAANIEAKLRDIMFAKSEEKDGEIEK